MSEVQELANVNTLGTKEGLRIIMPIINSNYKYESVYLYGSRGSGTSHLRSDYDFLVIVKLPFLLSAWRKFGLVYQLRRKYQIDLEIISTFALAHSAGGVEFSNWQRESHLVAGKKILPKRSNLTLRQISINGCKMSVLMLR